MSEQASIIELGSWLETPPGQYLLGWEQHRLDLAVANVFGFHALQLGLPMVDALQANRMPYKWVASAWPEAPGALLCEFEALPFADQSIDLVVLPHTLELARDPHQCLREVERVLMPEGRVVVTGFNPASLWGIRQRAGHVRRGAGLGRSKVPYLPRSGEFIGYWRLRDWLRLLGFELASGHFGCYRPPLHAERWLQRFRWMDNVGERWWPVLGAAYALEGVKRVRGMRFVGLAPAERRKTAAAAAVVNRVNKGVNKAGRAHAGVPQREEALSTGQER